MRKLILPLLVLAACSGDKSKESEPGAQSAAKNGIPYAALCNSLVEVDCKKKAECDSVDEAVCLEDSRKGCEQAAATSSEYDATQVTPMLREILTQSCEDRAKGLPSSVEKAQKAIRESSGA